MPDPPARGREAVGAFSEAVLRAFPDFQYVVKPPICVAPDGARIAVHWHVTATHSGPLTPPGFAPTGRRTSIDGVDLVDFRDGKVSRVLTLFDPFVGAEQFLGISMRPRPGSLRQRLLVMVQRVRAAWLRWHPSTHAA
jgi:predicted ester cyclase